jgi:hypothetical protein
MTMPPPAGPARPHSHRAKPQPEPQAEPDIKPRGITRIEVTAELPRGVNAMASRDRSTIYVSAALDKKDRRQAIRAVLRATHRFPSLVFVPIALSARWRRLVAEFGDLIASLSQHVTAFAASNPITAAMAAIATVAVVAGGTVAGVRVVESPSPPATAHSFAGHGSRPLLPGAKPDPNPVVASLPSQPLSYLGAYEPDSPQDYQGMEAFASSAGRRPNIALYYSGWYEKFRTNFADDALANGAIPAVDINPFGVSLSAIAAGAYDSTYLMPFANAVKAFGSPVIISFGHEPNGWWYPWAYGWTGASATQPPKEWVAAYRHIVQVFNTVGAENVTWLWQMNQDVAGTGPIAAYWPGAAYVNWVGIDGYYGQPADNFASLFGVTIHQVRALTGDPTLISETAITRGPAEPQEIANLFDSIRTGNYLGFVWFDKDQGADKNWALEQNTQAMHEFFVQTNTWRHLYHQKSK